MSCTVAQAGPHGFSGPIGKSLEECEKLPVVEFDKIEADMPASEVTDLSTDHKYLAEMCKAIAIRHCYLGLSRRDPGRLAHSR